jgi:tetratricopeptide (TPR) repeat protein
VQQGENHFDAEVRLGLLKAKTGDVEGARTYLKKIQTNNAKESTILIQAEAELLIDEQRYGDAMDVYNRALEGTAYNADLLYSRAMLAEKMDHIDILEKDLLRIITREPNHAQALNALGYTLADHTDRYQEAYGYIERALTLNPKDFYILDSMGWVLYRMGRLEQAKDYLRQAMELREDPEIAAHLVEVLWVTGQVEEAKKVWETALQTTPGDARLLDVIERFSPKDLPRP